MRTFVTFYTKSWQYVGHMVTGARWRGWGMAFTRALVLVTFALVPVWYRFGASPFGSSLYMSRFAITSSAAATVAVWLAAGLPGLRGLRQARWGGPWAAALLALALWMAFSGAWAFARAYAPDAALNAAVTFCLAALFALVTACTARPRWIVRALAVGVLFHGGLAVAQAINQGSLGLHALGEFTFSPDQPGVSVIVAGGWRFARPYGLLPHPNILAGALLLGVLAAAGGFVGAAKMAWFWRLIALAGVAVGGAGLLLSFSRSAWVGLAVGSLALLIGAFPLLRSRLGLRRLLVLAGVALLVSAAFFVAYRPLINARVGVGEESVELRSVADRLVYTEFALRSIGERPIFGVGAGSFPWRSGAYLRQTFYDLRGDHVHNIYLSAAAELGLIGLALLVLALGAGMAAAVAQVRASSGEERAARAALLAAGVGFAVIGWFDHYPYSILHMQIALWAALAAALAPGPPAMTLDREGLSPLSSTP